MNRPMERSDNKAREAWARFIRAGLKTRSAVLEAEWQEQVEQIAGLCGWAKFHVRDSRGSEEGFPDLLLIRPPRLLVAELKREGEKPTGAQLLWLTLFAGVGAETFVWRPNDFDEVVNVLR